MLDIKFIRENSEVVKKITQQKNINLDIDKLLRTDDSYRKLKQEIEKLQCEKNKIASQMKGGKPADELVKKGKEVKEKISGLDAEFKKVEKKYNELMLLTPNIVSKDTPTGKDENDNVEISRWGEPTKFDFEIKDHIELGKNLDILDIERGTKVSGYRGYFLKNEGVLMHLGLMMYALDKLVKKGFVPMVTPTIVREFALIGSGHFPSGKEEVFQIANPGKLASGEEIKESKFLVGTSEPSILAYRANEVIDEKELPLKYCGFSQCYRSEIGSYGKDAKGIYRIHEFMKIEQVIICKDDLSEADKQFEELRKIAEEILEELKLPYRVIQICTGDMGAGKYKMYDIETWMPSRNSYGETHSNSNLTDWQARRLNIKYKNKNGEKRFVYTLNNTAIASPRILIAILENYQQKNGSVVVPEVLRKWVGKDVIG
ncbi:MAG: serine--tRNA ligase [Patescibacteria group bacterium]|nr:serine--tRNA ligase [Patescibacteria group bacterium]